MATLITDHPEELNASGDGVREQLVAAAAARLVAGAGHRVFTARTLTDVTAVNASRSGVPAGSMSAPTV